MFECCKSVVTPARLRKADGAKFWPTLSWSSYISRLCCVEITLRYSQMSVVCRSTPLLYED